MSELTGRELDAALSAAFGWEIKYFPKCGYRFRKTPGRGHWQSAPSPSTDLNACREAEREMARRGLSTAYGTEVARMIKDQLALVLWSSLSDFHLVTADAETRCRAMLAALKSAEGQQS